jgi:hypothetical protein
MKMKKTINDIKKAIPNLDSDKVKDYADALDRVLVLKRIFQSEDGKVLIDELRKESISVIRKLIIAYKKKPELSELMGLIAVLDSNFTMLSKIQDISLEKELRESLDEAVLEATS